MNASAGPLPTSSDTANEPGCSLLLLAFLLWPIGSIGIDLLGEVWLNEFAPRKDFGLWASNVTIPCFYLGSVFLISRWLAISYPAWLTRVGVGAILVLLYTFGFAIWTFLTFPFGRICDPW